MFRPAVNHCRCRKCVHKIPKMTAGSLPRGSKSVGSRPDFDMFRVPSPRDRRVSSTTSRADTQNPALQAIIDNWSVRERPALEFDEEDALLVGTELITTFEIEGDGEKEFITVVFPWFIVSVCCSLDTTVIKLKNELFEKLKEMMVPEFSSNQSDYVFQLVGNSGEAEHVFNEETTLATLELSDPFPMLFLHEPDGLEHHKKLVKNIGLAIGYPLENLEESLDDELRQYRAWLFSITKNAFDLRGDTGFDHYAFPEEMIVRGPFDPCPHHLITKIKTSNLHYVVHYQTRHSELNEIESSYASLNVEFSPDYTPVSLVAKVIDDLNNQELMDMSDPKDEEYLLQLAGQKSFLTSDELLITYKGVRATFENYKMPDLVLRRKSIILKDYRRPLPLHTPNYVKAQERRLQLDGLSVVVVSTTADNNSDFAVSDFRPVAPAKLKAYSLWELDANLALRPMSCMNVGYADVEAVITLEFTVYCGKTILARRETLGVPSSTPTWNVDMMSFDLYMKDLPPSAVLGIRVHVWKPRRKEPIEVGWVNMSLTDWRDELRQGTQILNIWPTSLEQPCSSKIGENAAKLGSNIRVQFEIDTYGDRVKMPTEEHYTSFLEEVLKWRERDPVIPENYNPPKDDEDYLKLLELIRRQETGEFLNKEEEQYIWKWRKFLGVNSPDALIILCELDMVWRAREKFSELYVLLQTWRELSVGAALTLLGKRCNDRVLRKFAVEQLDEALDSNTLPLFILPLIQALKYEPRAQSDVCNLLLKKALLDYRVGHKLFWLLRAEIADLKDLDTKGNEFKRMALLIEAYLRGNEEHIATVVKQVDAVELLTKLSIMVKSFPKDVATRKFREELTVEKNRLEHMDSPLDPNYVLGEILIDKCKVLGSAKMPLRLAWKNLNAMSRVHQPVYEIIFKNGDDLRQDMLVLQVLEVMDSIWKRNQIDCFLLPYPVLPMGSKIGLIGVVPNCATIFEIQSEGGKVVTAMKALETTFLNKFIRQHAKSSKEYLESVDRFLWSCVGYSVATYIMGIRDRHHDNIMMTYDGKIFHIDFGHILGHGKTKLGIQRDRQSFVITEHFLCVIRKGKTVTKESHEVIKFKEQCVKAYSLLWEQRHLFESLFTLMVGMELPELATTADLNHIKKTMSIGIDDANEAQEFFSTVFEESFNKSWSTMTNWFFHAVKHA